MSGQKFLSFLNCLKSNKGHIEKKYNIEALDFNFGTLVWRPLNGSTHNTSLTSPLLNVSYHPRKVNGHVLI